MRAEQPSATAKRIARSLATLAAEPLVGQLVPASAAELSRRLAPRSLFGGALFGARLRRPLRQVLERLTIPGINLHYALRKRYLEETARAALHQGFRQVVICGAGFDTLALRLHPSFPTVQFIEIDHPATQRHKLARLAVNSSTPLQRESNLHFLPLDLTTRDFASQLAGAAGYRAGLRTLFIAEGLLMYLAPGEVDALFQFVRGPAIAAGAGSRFAFTFMEPRAGDRRLAFRGSTRAVDWWLRLRGEPFKWGIGREQLPDYLAARSFFVRELATSTTLRQRYLREPHLSRLSLAEGEHICVADHV
ncbi:MAG: SAM-dependent methyltransferase [Acidobacteriota bacterium]|nr:SAM-dependent methyltransferase [Acidobacteriota bacterium]